MTDSSGGNKNQTSSRSHYLRVSTAVLAVLVFTAACSGDSTKEPTIKPAETSAEPTTAPEPSPTPELTATPEPTPEPTPELTGDETVLEAWTGFVDGAIGHQDDEERLASALDHGSDTALAMMRTRFTGPIDREADQNSPHVTQTNTGWTIEAPRQPEHRLASQIRVRSRRRTETNRRVQRWPFGQVDCHRPTVAGTQAQPIHPTGERGRCRSTRVVERGEVVVLIAWRTPMTTSTGPRRVLPLLETAPTGLAHLKHVAD